MQYDKATANSSRSYNMKRIRGRDTSIEVKLRKALWRSGVRYRKNCTRLPGKPDIIILKYRIAIFCDGEFWHGKDWENKKIRIKNNKDYWINKIERNIARDNEINQKLNALGWTVIRFWGNDIKNDIDRCVDDIKDAIFYSTLDYQSNQFAYIDYFELNS
ncbi:MAG: very short patch repair endonuclease [Oscillospiraceae bacterium]|nr:very short patch repair endonuclease [Oscillospiraceae bacterium]